VSWIYNTHGGNLKLIQTLVGKLMAGDHFGD